MGRRRIAAAVLATLAAAGLAGVATRLPFDRADGPAPELLAALQRDLHLTADQARTRLAADHRAALATGRLRDRLGQLFGGAWITTGGGRLVVGVTDPAQVATVRSAGAEAQVVARSEFQLDGLLARLDRNAERAPRTVSSWHVDASTNTVVLVSTAPATRAAQEFAAASGVPVEAVRVVAASEQPRPLADLRGGDAYRINKTKRCSIGFAVQGGFVTAGHCGEAGDTTTGAKGGAAQGVFEEVSFPGDDFAFVRVNDKWTPRPLVNDYHGGTVGVSGSRESPVGATVCRSGSTTGWHCGTIQARNSSVRYNEGLVTGVTRTDVCAEPGDSGGAWVTGTQAQGVTSGGNGDCTSGGTTYFQPVNEILSTYGLKLITGSSTVNE